MPHFWQRRQMEQGNTIPRGRVLYAFLWFGDGSCHLAEKPQEGARQANKLTA